MSAHVAASLVVVVFGIPLSLVDLQQHRLPNRLVFAMAVASAVVVTWTGGITSAVIGAAGGFGFYLFLAALPGQGMGMGDVKLAGVLGALTANASTHAFVLWLLAPFLLGALASVAMIAARRAHMKTRFAFGPLMFLGAVAALLVTW